MALNIKDPEVDRLLDQAGMEHVLYVGDDDTDEDVFELDRPGLLTVRVGRKRSSSAQFYVDRQSEIRKVIASLGRNA